MRFVPSSLEVSPQDLRLSGGYYWVNSFNAGTASTSSFSPDYVYWYPLLTGRLPLSLSSLCINLSVGAAGSFRMGIYSSSEGVPTDLLHDFGEGSLNVAAGLVELSSPVTLEPNTLYFVALTAGIASTLYYRATTVCIPLGILTASPQYSATCYRLNRVYQALPATATGSVLVEAASFCIMKVA